MSHQNRSRLRRFAASSAMVALASGCLDRPVSPAKPHTTNIFVDAVTQSSVDKIDLLFMIDNSLSMKDKQLILEDAVPVLVERLVTPRCLDENGNSVGTAAADGTCAVGSPEFTAIKDIHIGVITSSLGTHGGYECGPRPTDQEQGRTPDDRAELLPAVRPGIELASWQDAGFLAWDPGQNKNTPPGEANLPTLIGNLRDQVRASGEIGCGFESSLEAWYRFLVDPEPPVSVSQVDGYNVKGAINEALLAQRRAFLRSDSLLAIVMLTDENDCSIDDEDGKQGFLVTSGQRMPRASSACALDPNDRCCHTCGVPAPEGCAPNDADTECSNKTPEASYATLTEAEDNMNVRCFDHKRRFGFDLLYSVGRYVDALTKQTVKNRAGADVVNPIFQAPAGGFPRQSNHVLLAGIVGVPWQDIATQASLEGDGLAYLDAEGLAREGRWDLILGNPQGNVPPADPHMRESITPRSGTNPLLGIPIAPATSQNPEENPINGHEQNVPGNNDLQYACTFALPTPRDCSGATGSCDCNALDQANNRPLCDYPNGPNTDGIQHSAKAYPGLRHLEVLKGVGENGVVASICPKNTAPAPGLLPATDPSYGYNPAVASLLALVSQRLGQCLPRELTPDTDQASETFGQVPCSAVEAVPSLGQACACDAATGRMPLDSSDLRRSVHEELEALARCGGNTRVACDSYCLCEVEQLKGPELAACQAGSNDPELYGYCYIDEAKGIGNPELVRQCPETERRLLHWVGEGLPANGALMLMACFGATL
jgi:hypothetical protein